MGSLTKKIKRTKQKKAGELLSSKILKRIQTGTGRYREGYKNW